ncbi:peptide chain release factor 1 [candidate division WWE3 bacterium]|nr:peptide chain release factor 1 [candidate division WWE3 bacterium]
MDLVIQQLEQQIAAIENQIESTKQLLSDNPEMAELVQEELTHLSEQKQALRQSIDSMNYDSSGDDSGSEPELINAIVEIRAAAGGNEAGLFAGDLYRMYVRFAERRGWKVHQLSMSQGGMGNIKEVTAEFIGSSSNPVYPVLQYESGVHRVQRVPTTESAGRIHTSTATVAVLPKVTPKQIEIKTEDLRIDTFRAGGPGGQSVNTTDSAVRITHLPTGVTVSMQDEKSQHKNKEKALAILSSRLFEMMRQQQKASLDEIRGEQIGSGERSEKIRTYNYPQNRITDHRIGESWHNLAEIMEGDLEDIVTTVDQKINEPDLNTSIDQENED